METLGSMVPHVVKKSVLNKREGGDSKGSCTWLAFGYLLTSLPFDCVVADVGTIYRKSCLDISTFTLYH